MTDNSRLVFETRIERMKTDLPLGSPLPFNAKNAKETAKLKEVKRSLWGSVRMSAGTPFLTHYTLHLTPSTLHLTPRANARASPREAHADVRVQVRLVFAQLR
ncbi:MAG: hypothetical protein ACI4P3_06375, partial [Candidatus Spyradosoma sp.]